jgi:hypothetical protein
MLTFNRRRFILATTFLVVRNFDACFQFPVSSQAAARFQWMNGSDNFTCINAYDESRLSRLTGVPACPTGQLHNLPRAMTNRGTLLG